MKKKKLGRPPKKKPIEEFVEEPEEVDVVESTPDETEQPSKPEPDGILCECGKEAHPGSHQCWACAHRA